MSDAEIDFYNSAIDRNKAAALADEEKRSRSLLANLTMPEDVAIFAKRLTGLRLSDAFILREARQSAESFEYDPEKRYAQEAQKRHCTRIRLLQDKSKKKSRGQAQVSDGGLAPDIPQAAHV